MVQAQSLRGYRELVGDLGGNPTRLLRQAGIDPGALSRLTAFISFESLSDLLERSAAELRCPDFGLRLAERQDIGILGTLSVAMRHSVTVGEAMQCVSKYLEVYNAALAFTIRKGEPRAKARLEFRLLPEDDLRWAQTAEHGIGLTWRIMTLLSEGRCQLDQVWFPHAAVATEAMYRARFNAPLVFRCRPGRPGRRRDRPHTAHQRKHPGALRRRHPPSGQPGVTGKNDPHGSSSPGRRGPVGHRHLQPWRSGESAPHAPSHPATTHAKRGDHLRSHQGRGPT